MSTAITLDESKRLISLESTIAKHIGTFIEVGEALAEIRDSKLYRVEFSTFEQYCREKWQMTQQYATQLMRSASVVSNLKTETIVSLPATESQARPLTKLPAEQQPIAWEAAVESAGGKQPTAKQVEAAVEVVHSQAHTSKRGPSYKPSNGMQYAEMAILNLEKIQHNDTEREAAFARVIKWINKNQ